MCQIIMQLNTYFPQFQVLCVEIVEFSILLHNELQAKRKEHQQ